MNIYKKGSISNIGDCYGGIQFYEVAWDSGEFETISEKDIQDEIIIENPWDLLANNILNDHKDYSIATTLHKVRNTTSNTISTLQASRTMFMPYQFKPLVKFLNSELKRILIADEVGLGKTIEAGHIMLELAARGNLRNVLVICTKALEKKWQNELSEKFNFILKVYNTTNEFIADIKNDVDKFNKSIFGIINYEKCRNKELQKIISESNYRFDLLICDEAHKIRNSETAQHKGVSKIVDQSDAVIFLTATPIMTSIDNLYNLIRVLDREGFDTYDIFTNAVNQNKPFIQAVRRLNANDSLTDILNELEKKEITQYHTVDREVIYSKTATVKELFSTDQLYARAQSNLLSGDNSIENRIRIQHDLIELNSLNHLYTRTRKRDVMREEDIVRRIPRSFSIYLGEDELALYNAVIEQYDQNTLGLITKKRQISSSIVAYHSKRKELLNGFYNKDIKDSKFNVFRKIVEEVCKNGKSKLIVFAFFTNTLLYLRIKLQELGINSELIYGGIKDRTERIDRFQNDENVTVLLSSEVGSEGIDLQFCNALVNYDLPWNPMVVEQRIGRIDRVGQRAEIINIYNLVLRDTIEERIHSRLYERINLFKESIGDMEEILGENETLGEEISKGIEELYKTRLTVEEQNQKLERMRLAIENERQTLKRVQADLQEAFANDIHFQNEIESITKNNRYITSEEIERYIRSIIRLHLSTIRFYQVNEFLYEFEIPANEIDLIFNFIEAFKDPVNAAPELEIEFRRFKTKHLGSRKIQFTLYQKYAYRNRTIDYISAYHPFINAVTNYFTKHGFDKNRAHAVGVKKDKLSNLELSEGYYISGIYKIAVEKNFGDGKNHQLNFIKSVIADLNGEDVELLSEEIGNKLNADIENNSVFLFDKLSFDNDQVAKIRNRINREIIGVQEKIREDEKIKFFSAINRRTNQELNYLDNRIRRLKTLLLENKGIERILKTELTTMEEKRHLLILNKEKATIQVSHSLISVNLLQVKNETI